MLYWSKKDKTEKNEETNERNERNLILTIPNLITFSRIVCIPFILYFIFENQHFYSCGLFAYAAISDFLDGYISRNFKNQSSFLGSILDPIADKLLIGSLIITLCLNQMIPLTLMILIVVRDMALIITSLYVRYTLLEKPVTLLKYVSLSKYSRTIVKVHYISKVNTCIQMILIFITMPSILLSYQGSIILTFFQYLTGFTTILSAISYIYNKDSYEVIN